MSLLTRWLAPATLAYAHCDLPCGVYDPEQANKQVSKVKASTSLDDAKRLLELVDEVDAAWKATGGPGKTRVAGRPG